MSQWKDAAPKGVNQFTESQLCMKKPQSMGVLGRPRIPPHRPPRLGQVPASPPKFPVSCSKCSCDFCLRPSERKGQHAGGLKPEPEAEAQRKDGCHNHCGVTRRARPGRPHPPLDQVPTGELPTPRTFFLLNRGGSAPNPSGTVQGPPTPPNEKNINPTGTK